MARHGGAVARHVISMNIRCRMAISEDVIREE